VLGEDKSHEEIFDQAAASVWGRYPAAWRGGSLVPQGNRGGFSGARLWRGGGAAGDFCLRAWPAGEEADRVRRLHQMMAHARGHGLDFVPAVHAVADGDTVVEAAGRVWELTGWLEGRADYAEHPAPARLEAAANALARLHQAWELYATPAEPCPAIRRRLDVLTDWERLVGAGWRPSCSPADPVQPVAERAWRLLPRWLAAIPARLRPWADHCRPLQPCLCDLWHDHLLFQGDRLTGLVDYGAVKHDHVAVDLARMLGSLAGDDTQGWEHGLRAYRRVRRLSAEEAALARVLDSTGTVLGMVNWLRWLYHDGRVYEDRPTVALRLKSLVDRVERWTPC
jgi:homoserine kinase type II